MSSSLGCLSCSSKGLSAPLCGYMNKLMPSDFHGQLPPHYPQAQVIEDWNKTQMESLEGKLQQMHGHPSSLTH